MIAGRLRGLDSTRVRGSIRFALFQQIPCALACLLMMDGGASAKVCAAAMLGFWAAVAWLLFRRPLGPSGTDFVFIRWGFLPLLLVSLTLVVFARR